MTLSSISFVRTLPLVLTVASGFAALTTGCAHQPVSMAEGPREYVPVDYDQVLDRWTRSGSVSAINEFDNTLDVTATFETWDFRWAYVVRYAADYRLTVEQRRSLLDTTLAETRKFHQFYVTLHGPARRENDISKKTSAWVVRLLDDHGNETAPSEIIPIRKPGAIERTYFPYTTVWRQAFRVRFPTQIEGHTTIAPDAHWIGLRVAGANGNHDIIWTIEGGAPAPFAPPSQTPTPTQNAASVNVASAP